MKINKFIDFHPVTGKYDPKWHDVNRVIVDGHWNPKALLYLAVFIYKHFQRSCLALKASIHHHIVDYTYTVISSSKHGYIVKYYVCTALSRAKNDIETLYSNKVVKDIATRFPIKVLNKIIEDFEPLLNLNDTELLNILKSEYPGVFSSEELWFVNELTMNPDVGESTSHIVRKMMEQLMNKVNLVRETIRCLVRISRELLECMPIVIAHLIKYRCYELFGMVRGRQ